jgi:hypothetical protein
MKTRIVGWHIVKDIPCSTLECTTPANVIVTNDYDEWNSCNEHAPSDARDEIGEIFAKAFNRPEGE